MEHKARMREINLRYDSESVKRIHHFERLSHEMEYNIKMEIRYEAMQNVKLTRLLCSC